MADRRSRVQQRDHHGARRVHDGAMPERIDRVVRDYLEVGRHSNRVSHPVLAGGQAERRRACGLLASSTIEAIRFETADDDAIVRRPPARRAPLQHATREKRSYGAVTGRIQTLTSRNALRFALYDQIHDRAVSCYLVEGGQAMMREMWDRMAIVEGWVSRDPSPATAHDPARIECPPLPEREPDAYKRARGRYPGAMNRCRRSCSAIARRCMSAPRVYWDATCCSPHLNAVPDRLPVIDELLRSSRAKEIEIITSSVSIAEVAFAQGEKEAQQLDAQVEQDIDELWAPGSPVATVEFYDLVAFEARRPCAGASRRAGGARSPSTPSDVATASIWPLPSCTRTTIESRLGTGTAIPSHRPQTPQTSRYGRR